MPLAQALGHGTLISGVSDPRGHPSHRSTGPITSENTIEASLPGGALAWTAPGRRWRRPWLASFLALFLLLALAAAFVRLPYYVIAPGTARDVDRLVAVEGATTYPPKGKVLFTTVSVGQVANVYEALAAWLDPASDVVPERDLLGPRTDRRQYQRQSVESMSDSKQTAEYVVFRRLGYQVARHGQGAQVVDVMPDYPVFGKLTRGEVIVAVDGGPVRLADDLITALGRHAPGDVVRLQVRSSDDAAPHEVVVPLRSRKDGSPMLGVTLQTYQPRFDFPFKVNIDSGEVAGPSAGLAFTLTLLDVLTPGELTGGITVATTGTIDPQGRVGPVGGVAQKTAAVERAGAQLFLVPSEEYELAKASAHHGLRVEKTDDLDQALSILARLPGSNAGSLISAAGEGTATAGRP